MVYYGITVLRYYLRNTLYHLSKLVEEEVVSNIRGVSGFPNPFLAHANLDLMGLWYHWWLLYIGFIIYLILIAIYLLKPRR